MWTGYNNSRIETTQQERKRRRGGGGRRRRRRRRSGNGIERKKKRGEGENWDYRPASTASPASRGVAKSWRMKYEERVITPLRTGLSSGWSERCCILLSNQLYGVQITSCWFNSNNNNNNNNNNSSSSSGGADVIFFFFCFFCFCFFLFFFFPAWSPVVIIRRQWLIELAAIGAAASPASTLTWLHVNEMRHINCCDLAGAIVTSTSSKK